LFPLKRLNVAPPVGHVCRGTARRTTNHKSNVDKLILTVNCYPRFSFILIVEGAVGICV